MRHWKKLRACLIGIAALALAVGCKKGSSSSAAAGGTATAQTASARPIFDQNCAKCHAIAGAPATGGGKGPDLSRVGANTMHTVSWISEHIRNPKAHKPESRMPSFDGKLPPADIQSLAEFLAAMK